MLLANLITLARLPLLLAVLGLLLYSCAWHWQMLGLGLLGVLFLMDWLDGVVARQRREATDLGAVLDIALDRTVENVLWIAFLRLDLVSFWVPVIFLVRSFVVDGIRGVALAHGKAGFSMMYTPWGRFLVGSRFMRGFYGLAKVVTFGVLWLTHALVLRDPQYLVSLKPLYQSLIWLTVGLCLARGLPVLLDGRLYFNRG
uniref:CDP-alcohol phosphatidyltransferase family protein n=1 Tax=Desulfobacca acetoxidans TaxID=60893 RepID=A0A7C3Z1C7_9BACT